MTGAFVDPIVTAINEYLTGWDAFCAAPDQEADEAADLWAVPHRVLSIWDRGCQTREGAVLALSLALREEEFGVKSLSVPLMRAALSYLQGHAAETAPPG
ncbi:MAG: hypothetical protein BGO05_15970 [Rhizobiales bacterium 63-7]|nr:hypothetical protein [Hyphomicrobiales bacterium]OJU69537.1 MAG: hypothetical protein BGO05_15970 [Rhizobiales bacterium 63-7]